MRPSRLTLRARLLVVLIVVFAALTASGLVLVQVFLRSSLYDHTEGAAVDSVLPETELEFPVPLPGAAGQPPPSTSDQAPTPLSSAQMIAFATRLSSQGV